MVLGLLDWPKRYFALDGGTLTYWSDDVNPQKVSVDGLCAHG